MAKNYILHNHKDSSVSTLSDLLSDLTSIIYGWNLAGFLYFESEESGVYPDTPENRKKGQVNAAWVKKIRNIDRIVEKYEKSNPDELEYFAKENSVTPSKYEKDLLKLESLPSQTEADKSNLKFDISIIKRGTTFAIPFEKVNKGVAIGDGDIVDIRDYETFLADNLKYLREDINNFPIHKLFNREGTLDKVGKVLDYFPKITVWMWVRSLHKFDLKDNPQGTLIDVTPFIKDIQSSVSLTDGGSFNLTLDNIPAIWGSEGWEIDGKKVRTYKNGVGKTFYACEIDISANNFFENIIHSNDLIWIRYETLKNEVDYRRDEHFKEPLDYKLANVELVNKIYDFIGLVDEKKKILTPSNNQIKLDVSGRDLKKLLIDDAVYVYPSDMIASMFANEPEEKYKNRINGKYVDLAYGYYKSIEFSLKFMINALSGIDICPDHLFNAYGNVENYISKEISDKYYQDIKLSYPKYPDIRSYQFNVGLEKGQNAYTEVKASGIWQIIKLAIDDRIREYRIIDSSLESTNGSLMDYVNKVCQNPFVEFFSDTYADQFYFVARRPPTDVKGINDYIDDNLLIMIDSQDTLSFSINNYKGPVYSWYRVEPTGELPEDVKFAFIKAVRFPRYADIYGERALEVSNNYSIHRPVGGYTNATDIPALIEIAIYDLKYLIESNMYLPFTREATLTINGDRRIKVGTWVYYQRTDEIFYVNNVTNTYSSTGTGSRTTVLQLTRGMVFSHLDKYFKIIKNLEIDKKVFSNPSYEEWSKNVFQKWEVDDEIFNFFLYGRQWDSNDLVEGEENLGKSKKDDPIRKKLNQLRNRPR